MIQTGLMIPQDWYKTEIREAHIITSEMKRVWAYELDMLYQVQKICDKYNIKWFVDGGTLLGAVRHKGFIPWDDDIDIFMPREDYDRFIQIAKFELFAPYYIQDEYDELAWNSHTKIRYDGTTAILDKDAEYRFDFHQGIFIDIFPFDNVPNDVTDCSIFINKLHLIRQEIIIARTRWWMYERDNKKLHNHCIELRDQYEELRRLYNNDDSCLCGANLGLPFSNNDIRKLKSEYNEFVIEKFEMLFVRVPIGYDSILTRLYGDYEKPIKGSSHHGNIIFDPFFSYKQSTILGNPIII